ncbi:DUF4157 domain-containing protein [Amycolatopsis sp. NPDC059021]|uniref:eCIS core domain-containing protein n=1 Tax=Amycolatopsis sp. NPDC059021 TaxID=3346704 RepID=UPI00366DDCAF
MPFEPVRRRPPAQAPAAAPAPDTTAGPEPLPDTLRRNLEARLGGDFSRIRVSSGAQTADAAGARAWSMGDDLWFARAEYRPGTRRGDELIAHELAHTMQQHGSPDSSSATSTHPVLEREADAVAAAYVAGSAVPPISRRVGGRRRRKEPEALSVVPSMAESDKTRSWFDPADKTVKPVWTEASGYVKNPSARKLESLVQNGKIGGGFENGVFPYAIDTNGEAILGKRLGERGGGPGRATGLPHPTLIGGKNPTGLAFGDVEIRAGRIYRIDNQSGHMQPGRARLGIASKTFLKLPTSAFHPDFFAESVHFDAAGGKTTQRFRSLDMLKLKMRDFKRSLRVLKPRALAGRFRSPKFRAQAASGAKAAAAILAMLLLDYLMSEVKSSIDDSLIQQQIDKLGPEIERKLAAQGEQLDALLAEDSEAEVQMNVRFDIIKPQIRTFGEGETTSVEGLPMVELAEVGFSRQPWDATPTRSTQYTCGSTLHTTRVTVSQPFDPGALFTGESAPESPAK